jgi:hypothetical protein
MKFTSRLGCVRDIGLRGRKERDISQMIRNRENEDDKFMTSTSFFTTFGRRELELTVIAYTVDIYT